MNEQLSYYLERYAAGVLTVEERSALQQLFRDPAHGEAIQRIMDEEWPHIERSDIHFPEEIARLHQSITEAIQQENTFHPVHRVHFMRKWWWAAAIIIILGSCIYLWDTTRHTNTAHAQTSLSSEISPGSNKAILTLSDGSQIILDSASNGPIAKQQSTAVIKSHNGQVVYDAGAQVTRAVMNTMTTPKGGQYQLTLADGTRVWLNAASRITYPTAFTEKNRTVQVTGEAYFEVAKNKEKPFIVQTSTDAITVLGTSFNVNAYPDETAVKTSLLEGMVKVNDHSLSPGQGCADGKVFKTSLDQDLAWKNGEFNFSHQSFGVIMRQLSRWYNIDVKYTGPVPEHSFIGSISRSENLSTVLTFLQASGVHFQIDPSGKVLLVTQ